VRGAEDLYLGIAAREQEIERGRVGLNDLERAVQETQLLRSLGRASDLQCRQAEAARDLAQEQLDTLLEKSRLWKTQLQYLIGQTPTGTLTLASVPDITDEQLASLEYDADLKSGMENSYDLYLAQNDVTDAMDAWKDADAGYQKNSALHSYNAAVSTYEAKRRAFSSPSTPFIRASTQRAAPWRRHSEPAACSRRPVMRQPALSTGLISKSALLVAQSDLALAQLAVQSAQLDLVSAYQACCWARRGLLSAQA
jgi:outer membrane protein TolC